MLLNKNNLNLIEDFLVEFYEGNIKEYRQLIYYYLLYFKSLKRLSIFGNCEKDFSQLFKVVPSLCELNIKIDIDLNYLDSFQKLKKAITQNIIMVTYSSRNESFQLSS